MDEQVGESLARRRFLMTLMALFAVVAAILAVIGVYGVMAYIVSQGTRDMGMRLALGATPASIQRLVLSRGAVLGIGGVVLGLASAAGLTRLMQSVLFGVAPVDVLTFAAIGAIILLVVLVASAFPARRASRTDPTGGAKKQLTTDNEQLLR